MVREITAVDVTSSTDVLRLAEEVRRGGQPRLLRRDSEDLAILSPVVPKVKRPPRRVKARSRTSVAEATFGGVPPRQRPEDFTALRRAFEEGAAQDAIAETAP